MRNYSLRTKKGFTLAEVLITLGIIGVVAALTIPTLVHNYKKKILETKLLRVYSVMNQAIKLSTVENGGTETWDNIGSSTSSTVTYEDALAWYNKYLANYLNVLKVEKYNKTGKDFLLIYFHDGSVLSTSRFIGEIYYFPNAKDVGNGKWGINDFVFWFMPKYSPEMLNSDESPRKSFKYAKNLGFVPYPYSWDGTYDGAMHDSIERRYGCAENGALCTKLIQLNNWKIPDDYPLKF